MSEEITKEQYINEIYRLKQQLRREINVKKAYKGQLETFKQHLYYLD